MEDGNTNTNTTNTEGNEASSEAPKAAEETSSQDDSNLSVLDKAKAYAERAEKAAEALKIENDRSEKLQAETLLSGTAGGKVEPVVKEESPEDYAARVMAGEVDEKED